MSSFSALYVGRVAHRRLRPVRHHLAYHVFYLLIDLDELAAQGDRLRLLGCNRRGILSFRERDHGLEDGTPLKEWVNNRLGEAGLGAAERIRLLCMPRVFGYVFNPLSVFYCHRADGSHFATLLQVNNTFGERHVYLVPNAPDAQGVVRQQFDKQFYVSPFMDMAMRYDLRLTTPGPTLGIVIRQGGEDGTVMIAGLSAIRHELSDRALLRALISQPLLTIKVIAGIHFEALLLWLKGMRVRRRPKPPERLVSIAASPGAGPT